MNRLKTIVFFFALIASSVKLFAQNGLFLAGSLEFSGLGQDYNFREDGSVLAKKWKGTKAHNDFDVLYNPEFVLQYNFLDHFGVSFNLKLTDKASVFHDRRFMNAYDIHGVDYVANHGVFFADSGNFNPNKRYISPGISAYYFFNSVENASGPYLSYGLGFNQFLGKSLEQTATYFHDNSDQLLELGVHYRRRYISHCLEAGYIFYPDYYPETRGVRPRITTKHLVFSIAVRYTFAGTYMDADYRVSKNNSIQYTDHLAAGGSYLSFVLKVGGGIFGNRIDKLNKKIYDNAQLKKQVEKAETDSIAEANDVRKRDVSIKDEIVVKNPNITISVWDHLKYDKDIISLGLDDKMILENYTLQLSKKNITLNLTRDINSLVLYAISEGTEKPCTVAILIDDGVTQQQIILNSSMTLSEGIHIRVAE